MIIDEASERLAARVGDALRGRGWRLATAESCTGGLIGAALTAVAGSSAWYQGGCVVYANEAKTALLGVDEAVLIAHGAVSEPVALAMAAGVRARLGVEAAVAVTGVAGPGGGTPAKPVGTVCIAWSTDAEDRVLTFRFEGDRAAVRRQSVEAALRGLLPAAASAMA